MAKKLIGRSAGTHRSRGQSLVEFALVLPVLILVIALAVDLGRAFYFEVTTTEAARDAAREAIGQPQSQKQGPGIGAICAAVQADLTNVRSTTCGTTGSPRAAANQAVVVVHCPDSGGGCAAVVGATPLNGTVTVDVYYGFPLLLPGISQLVPGGLIQIHNSAQMVTSW
jgi:Flp pilus assembly protein TadG